VNETDQLGSRAWRRVLGSLAGLGCAVLAPFAAQAQSGSGARPYDGTSFSNPYAPGGPYDPYRYERLGRDPYGLHGGSTGTVPNATKPVGGAHAASRLRKAKKLMQATSQGHAAQGTFDSSTAANPLQRLDNSNPGSSDTGLCAWPAQTPASALGALPLQKSKNGNAGCGAALGGLSGARSRSR